MRNSCLQENGPFTYTASSIGDGGLLYDNVTLQENPYSWSKVSFPDRTSVSIIRYVCIAILKTFPMH